MAAATLVGVAGYDAIEVLGEGASSHVFLARRKDEPGGGLVVVKRAKVGANQSLQAELRVLVRVRPTFGPQLVASGQSDEGQLYLAFAHRQGVTARDRSRARSFSTQEIFALGHMAARALEELHEAGICHGDVKLDNMLVHTDAHDGVFGSLLDFGFAVDTGAPLVGFTPSAAAPELNERMVATPQADVFALGRALAEVAEAGPEVPAALRTLLDAMCAPAPGARPSAASVAATFQRQLPEVSHSVLDTRRLRARVQRTYLAEREEELRGTFDATGLSGPPREWMLEAQRMLSADASAATALRHLAPLSAFRAQRWLSRLLGATVFDLPSTLPEEARVAQALLDLAGEVGASLDALALGILGVAEVEVVPAHRLVRMLALAPATDALLLQAELALRGSAAPEREPLALAIAEASLLRGDLGRALQALAGVALPDAEAMRAEIYRRQGRTVEARCAAEPLLDEPDAVVVSRARGVLARLSWDAGDDVAALAAVEGALPVTRAEAQGLVAYRSFGRASASAVESAVHGLRAALPEAHEPGTRARLSAVLGMLEHRQGNAQAAHEAFHHASSIAARCCALPEEANYRTGEAAAASDAGLPGAALASATRACLLFARMGDPFRGSRAALARAAALASLGQHAAAAESAGDARDQALRCADHLCVLYAELCLLEVHDNPETQDARAEAVLQAATAAAPLSPLDRVRVYLGLLRGAPALAQTFASAPDVSETLPRSLAWELLGVQAQQCLAEGEVGPEARAALSQVRFLLREPAPPVPKGPALLPLAKLARALGDAELALGIEEQRALCIDSFVRALSSELVPSALLLPWVREPREHAGVAPAQLDQLMTLVRSLGTRERLRPLLDQVLGALLFWTGAERGLFLVPEEGGRFRVRAARNLEGQALTLTQLELSQGLARRALELGRPLVATDARETFGDLHASVHLLKLRSVLAVPLTSRGETHGVVYLDDRARRLSLSPAQLQWVELVAAQAAMAIADAKDHLRLRLSARRTDRANKRLERALQTTERQLEETRGALHFHEQGVAIKFDYSELRGRSEPMIKMLRVVDRVTQSDVPVLITGESGTGKELVARAIHHNGSRSRRPFVSENCASVPEALLESTLFGHVKGAFTGAHKARVGLFEIAAGGTLFLDEVGEMPLSMQAKLLRVLQDGEVRPIGGERSRKTDARILAATHRDLARMVAEGTFREDLFYRLHVVTVAVPPLRARSADLKELVQHFVSKYAQGRDVTIAPRALARLSAYEWPGNVRQLENEVRRALVLADDRIDLAELSPELRGEAGPSGIDAGLLLRPKVDALEAKLVRQALEQTRGNQTKAAELLGLSRFGLQKMMQRLSIRGPQAAD
jgi:serine/threonine-protein kinase PknK